MTTGESRNASSAAMAIGTSTTSATRRTKTASTTVAK